MTWVALVNRFRRSLGVLAGVALLAGVSHAQLSLVSNDTLKVRVNDGVGLLASPNAYKTIPVGAAHVFGGRRPDIFINATRGIEPALYLYRWVRDNENGQPIFAPPVKVKHPFAEPAVPEGAILHTDGGRIQGFWFDQGHLVRCVFDPKTLEFKQDARLAIKGLPRAPSDVTAIPLGGDRLQVIVSCSNGARYRPAGDQSSDDYVLYNGAGVFRGEWPYSGLYSFEVKVDLSQVTGPPALLSQKREEVRSGGAPLSPVTYDSLQKRGIIAGANLGNLYFFPFSTGGSRQCDEKRMLFSTAGHSIRHPTVGATPIVYPNQEGEAVDLMVGGEGALFYYRFTGRFHENGHPVYGEPEPVWQEDAMLFTGTLPVPSVVDWDGDSATDLIVGNSEGLVLLFKNHGSDRDPKFGIGEPLRANGEVIHVQPGYYGIQGPFETRWGYTCPNVADWNGDGLPDLLLSSATAKHEVFLNIGTRTEPRLAAGRSIFFDGLELHGTWRVRPGVARIDGRMAYIIQDDENALHLYWRIDDYNVEDGGQLRLTNGRNITSHITGANTGPGQKGRAKIEIVDWDGDGKFDLFVGTAKRGSFPEPDIGLPWARRRTGANLQVVFFRNVGTNAVPVYEYPRQLQFRGTDIYYGAHANSPVACNWGDTSRGPNLLIGMEAGRIYFFQHEDVTFLDTAKSKAPTTRTSAANDGD